MEGFVKLLNVFVCAVCGGMTLMLTVLNQNFPVFELREHPKICVLPVEL
jgi:hypothetical protein